MKEDSVLAYSSAVALRLGYVLAAVNINSMPLNCHFRYGEIISLSVLLS